MTLPDEVVKEIENSVDYEAAVGHYYRESAVERIALLTRRLTIEEAAHVVGELDGGEPERDLAIDEAIAAIRQLEGK